MLHSCENFELNEMEVDNSFSICAILVHLCVISRELGARECS